MARLWPGAVLWLSVLVVGAALYALCAAWIPFYNKSEPREALVVRAVLAGEHVVLPEREEGEVPSKPPLFHWLAAVAVAAGVRPEELAMRAPSVLLGAGTLALTAAAAARWYGGAAGILAAAALGSSHEWMRSAIQARVDVTLSFFVTAAALAWNAGLGGGTGRWAIRCGYLLATAAVLTKGPVGLVLPWLIAAGGAAATRIPRRLARLLDPVGVGAMVALVCAWYVLAWESGGETFLARQIVRENIQRFLGSGEGAAHPQPFFYFALALPGAYLPWTLALPGALWLAWRERSTADRRLLAWILAVFVFYSLASGKRSAYLLPLFPALAMLTGRYVARAFAGTPTRAAHITLYVLTGALAVVTAALALGWETRIMELVLAGLHGQDRARFPVALVIVARQRWAIVAALGAIAAGMLALAAGGTASRQGRAVAVLGGVAVAWVGAINGLGTYRYAREATLRPFASQVRTIVDDDDILWRRGFVDYGFRYYVERPLRAWKERGAPSTQREFTISEASDESEAGAVRHGLTTRLIDTRPHAAVVLELHEVRGARDAALVPPLPFRKVSGQP